jgi:hypothetical protein
MIESPLDPILLLFPGIISSGHPGISGEGAGVPGAYPLSFFFISNPVDEIEAETGGTDIGTTSAVLASEGQILP